MKGHKMKYTLTTILFSLAVFASCGYNESEEQYDAVEQEINSIFVLCQQRKIASGINIDEEGDDSSIIFKEGDKLYISQMGASTDPDIKGTPYIYEYHENKDAKWEDNENFSPIPDKSAIDWTTVKGFGSVGNTFSFYAMHFPIDNEVKFSVEQNQRTKEDFMKSDIMGAYHATSSLYTRLRFRLFHLMVYLKVTLYVPVYEDTQDGSNISYSGFYKDAVQGAFVMNAHTGFSIEWRANRSSDTEAPLTQPAGGKANIAMFGPLSNEEETEIEVKKYYTKEDLGTDRVRVYNFSVLFPAQTFGDNFLCFALKTPNETMKYYYFSGSQIIGESENYSLTQGTLQQLYLYLPRKTNETILVGAKILPWKDAVTDMTVTKQDSNQDNKDGDRND